MKVTIGADNHTPMSVQRAIKKSSLASSLSVSIGADPPMSVQRANKKAQLLAAVGGPVSAASCSPGGCEEPIDPRVLASVINSQQGTAMTNPQGSGFSDVQWNALVGMINANKYCPSPRRVGWQQSSMTFQSLAVNNNAQATITITPGQAFCMNALVAAQGSALDIKFQIDSLVYNSIEYVTNGPWWSLFYTSAAACCLCVRELPIIDPNTSVVMLATNVNGAAADLRVQVFGDELFC